MMGLSNLPPGCTDAEIEDQIDGTCEHCGHKESAHIDGFGKCLEFDDRITDYPLHPLAKCRCDGFEWTEQE